MRGFQFFHKWIRSERLNFSENYLIIYAQEEQNQSSTRRQNHEGFYHRILKFFFFIIDREANYCKSSSSRKLPQHVSSGSVDGEAVATIHVLKMTSLSFLNVLIFLFDEWDEQVLIFNESLFVNKSVKQ